MAAALNILIGATLAAGQVSAGNPIGGVGGGGGGTQAAVAPPASPSIDWAGIEFQPNVVGMDEVVDMVYWVDDPNNTPLNPNDDIPYVFVTGYQTTVNGATIFATHKYFAINGPGLVQPILTRYWPPTPATAVGTNKAVALAVNSQTGDLFVTGEADGGLNGQDYWTIKYDHLMNLKWSVRYDSPAHLDDVPAAISFNVEADVVAVTGRSRMATDDIMTVLYNAADGTPSALWAGNTHGLVGERRWDIGGNETPVGVKVLDVVVESVQVDVAVAGTAYSGNNKDIVTLFYNGVNHTGALTGQRLFDLGGDDIATGFSTKVVTGPVGGYESHLSMCFVTGSVDRPTSGDTDYVVLAYYFKIDQTALPVSPPSFVPFGDVNHRTWSGPAALGSSDDGAFAVDIGLNSPLLWLTGRVREADGTGYDIGTVAWDFNNYPLSVSPDHVWVWDAGPGFDDWGTAIKTHGSTAFVGGRSSGVPFRAVTLKFDTLQASTPKWVGYFHGVDPTTQVNAVIAPGSGGPVFMGGSPGIQGLGSDQVTVRYKQPQ